MNVTNRKVGNKSITAHNNNETNGNNGKRLTEGCTSLMYACQHGLTDRVVEELRKKPNTVLHRDKTNKSALHYCTGQSNLVTAASVAVAAPNLMESADEDGFTPLHLAVIQGNLSVVNLLLANNADVNALDNEGHSVVHWATVCGEIEALRAVLAAGANIATPDINGGSPLHYAAQMCGANYDGKTTKAASRLALVILNVLLAHPGSSVEVEDKDGRQPLLWAASAGSSKAVLALLKAGARVESADKDGLTALHCAASRGHTDCIDTLINLAGTQTDLIDCNGCTALHYAVTLGHADATVLLLKLGADPNRQDRKGRTPAHCGCAKGQMETIKILGQHSGNLWLRNAKGDLPVHEAANSGRRELVEWLLEQKPSFVNTPSNDGKTLLHVAASTDNSDMCKMLLDMGADVNSLFRTSKNTVYTPLDWALLKGFRSTAKFIQMNGGLPAKKLRLSGKTCSVLPETVLPLKSPDVSHLNEELTVNAEPKPKEPKKFKTKSSSKRYVIYVKQSDSESYDERFYGRSRKRYRQSHHSRRTNSCSEVFDQNDIEDGDELNRSRSNMELHRHERCCCHNVFSTAESSAEEECRMSRQPKPCRGCRSTLRRIKARNREDSECCDCKKNAKKKRKKETCGKKEAGHYDDETSDNDSERKHSETPRQASEMVQLSSSQQKMSNVQNESEINKEDSKGDAPTISHSRPSSARKRPQSAKYTAVQKRKEQRQTEESEQRKAVAILRTLSNELSDSNSKSKHIVIQAEVHLKYEELEPQEKVTAEEDIQTDATYTVDQPDQNDVTDLQSEGPPSFVDAEPTEVNKITAEQAPETNDTTELVHESPKKVTFQQDQETEREKVAEEATAQEKIKETIAECPIPEVKPIIDVNVIPAEVSANDEIEIDTRVVQNLGGTAEKETLGDLTADEPADDEASVKSFMVLDQNENENENKPVVLPDTEKERSASRQSESFQLIDEPKQSAPPASNGKSKRSKKQAPLKTAESETEDELQKNKDQDSGFEPSPISLKSSKIPTVNYRQTYSALPEKDTPAFTKLDDLHTTGGKKLNRKPGDKNACNMSTVTQSIQKNVRRYCMERKIFQHLLELKSLQIRSNKTNEAILVKRAVEDYHKSTVALGYETGRTLKRYPYTEYTFKNFELFLYETLKGLQKNGTFNFQNITEVYREAERRLSPDANAYERALQCTTKTHRCLHAAHAYTGIPCAAYIPMLNHHTIPKFGFGTYKNGGVGSFYLPKILLDGKKCSGRVALELSHGSNKQLIPLPSDKMDSNKKYYVTFTVKDNENQKQQLIEKAKNE